MRGPRLIVVCALVACSGSNRAAVPAPVSAPPPPPWMSDVRTLFGYVQKSLVDAGFPEASTATLEVGDGFYPFFYQYQGGTVFANELPADERALRQVIDRSDRILAAGLLAPAESMGGSAAAVEGLRVWALAAGAHELCHHVQHARRSRSFVSGSMYEVEAECHLFEVAMIDQAIARGDAPARWRALFRRFVVMSGTLGDGMAPPPAGSPREVMDPSAAGFVASWRESRGEAGFAAYEELATVTAVLTAHRLAVIDGTPAPTFAALARAWDGDPLPMTPSQPASSSAPSPSAAVTSTKLRDGTSISCPPGTTLRGGGDISMFSAAFCARADGRRHGPFISWYLDGAAKARGAYVDGLLDGEWTVWYGDGKVQARGSFARGVRVGAWIHNRPDGATLWAGELRDGKRDVAQRVEVEIYGGVIELAVRQGAPDGELKLRIGDEVALTGAFAGGLPAGPWVTHDFLRPAARVDFAGALPVSIETYANRDHGGVTGKFVDGVPHGTWRVVDLAGKVVQVEQYDHGLPTGDWQVLDATSQLVTASFADGWPVSGEPATPFDWRRDTGIFSRLGEPELYSGGVGDPWCRAAPVACGRLANWRDDRRQFVRVLLYIAGGSSRVMGFPPPGAVAPDEGPPVELAELFCVTAREAAACAYAAAVGRARAKTPAERRRAAGLAWLGCRGAGTGPDVACAVVTDMVAKKEVVAGPRGWR